MSSQMEARVFQVGIANIRFYETFLWGLAALGFGLFLMGVVADQPGAPPLAARAIVYGLLLAITGAMVWFGVTGALKYRHIVTSGAAANHAVRLEGAGLTVTGQAGQIWTYRWADFAEVTPDSVYLAIGRLKPKAPGALLMFRTPAGPAGLDRRRAIARAMGKSILYPIEDGNMVVIPLRFFHQAEGQQLAVQARALHQKARATGMVGPNG